VCGKAGQDPAQMPWSRRYMYGAGAAGNAPLAVH
jgi:hypothetical protein